MLKGTITKLTTFLCSIFLVLLVVVPFHISAESAGSYNEVEANTCNLFLIRTVTSSNAYVYSYVFNNDVDVVIMHHPTGNSDYETFYFSRSTFKWSYVEIRSTNQNNPYSCPNPTGHTATSKTIGNYSFYYGSDLYSYSSSWPYGLNTGYVSNESIYSSVSDGTAAQRLEEAYNIWLLGNPAQTLNYGSLITGYSTKFVTTNFEGLNDRNIDTITWSDNDSNGNFIGGLDYQVEIRALPAYYTANSAADLVQQTVVNLVKGLATWYSNGVIQAEPEQYYTLVKTSASRKEFSIMWSDVINHFPQNWARLFNEGSLVRNLSNQEVWYKTGWLYEIRFIYHENESDEYISDWQTIYQVTAVDPGTSTNIIQTAPQGLSPELYNLLQTVNTLNNTVQNWNINGVPVNMEPQTAPTQDGSWLEYIVDAISKIVGQIVETLGNIVEALLGFGSDIIEGLFNLITSVGVNIIDTFTDLWNRLIELIDNINFTDENPEYDLNPETGESVLDIIPAFIRMINTSGLGYMIWIPFVVGIVFMIL